MREKVESQMSRMQRGIALGVLIWVLVACGEPDASQIAEKINNHMDKLQSYQAKAKMVMHTGEKPITYHIEMWYKNPQFFRIHLVNDSKEISQMILKNKEGVFVLTPELKKSFRFQSHWPEKQSQVYLYQSLMKHIVEDEQRKMTIEGDSYVFRVQAHYAHNHFSHQRIWINKKNFAPTQVEVVDHHQKTIIQVEFTSFEFDVHFEDQVFDRERNEMSSLHLGTPPNFMKRNPNLSHHVNTQQTTDFGIIEPAYLPPGTKKQETIEMKIQNQSAILLRYSGAYQFSLMESRPKSNAEHLGSADLVDLGYTKAILSENEPKWMTWIFDNIEYRLISHNLPIEEMVKVAKAIPGQSGK